MTPVSPKAIEIVPADTASAAFGNDKASCLSLPDETWALSLVRVISWSLDAGLADTDGSAYYTGRLWPDWERPLSYQLMSNKLLSMNAIVLTESWGGELDCES